MYDEFLDEFMPSEMMRGYLKGADLCEWQITELVYFSPVPVSRKREAFRRLIRLAGQKRDKALRKESARCLWNLDEAMRLLEGEEVFTVEMEHFDTGRRESRSSFEELYASFGEAMEFIREETEYWEDGEWTSLRFLVGKWELDGKGRYRWACGYTVAGNEILFVDLGDDRYGYENVIGSYGGQDLNLPVPFRAGDLLELDGFPFGPKMHALIMETGDNWDCCCVQGLAKNENGQWGTGAVKHGMVGCRHFTKTSPLYSARMYGGPLPEDEKLLMEVKEYIGGDEKRGRELNWRMSWDGMTDGEVRELLRADGQIPN